MKRLVIMRHAKSDWSGGLADHDRPLSKRGTRAARTMGRVLDQLGEVPDRVLSSTATRAHTTALLAAETGSWPAIIETTGDLYGTSVERVLEVTSRTPEDTERLMLVGHQPTWGALVEHLTGGAVQVKTATAVGIDLYVRDWADVMLSRGELVYVLQPRMFGAGWDGHG